MASEQFDVVLCKRIYATDAIFVRDVAVTGGGGGGGGVASLTSQGAGTSIVYNSTGVLKSVSAGANVTITESTPGVLVIAATAGGGGVASLTSQGAGTSIVFNATGVLKSVSAGANITITESTPGVLVFAATGASLPAVGASGNVLTSDGSVWSSQALPTTGDEGSTLPAVGTSGNVLTSDGSVWSSQPPSGDSLPAAGATGNVLTSDGSAWWSQALPTTGDEGSTLPAPGSTGNVLTSDGTVWSSQAPPGLSTVVSYIVCGVNALGDTAVGPGSTTLTWNTGVSMKNVNNCVTLGGSNTTFTPTRDGEYDIGVTVQFVNKSVTDAYSADLRIMRNGTLLRYQGILLAIVGLDMLYVHWTGNLTTSDVLSVVAGGATADVYVQGAITGYALSSFFSMRYLGVA